jgi:hypothetical protein
LAISAAVTVGAGSIAGVAATAAAKALLTAKGKAANPNTDATIFEYRNFMFISS